MPIVPFSKLLSDARRGGYAVCYCESWNLESLLAVVEAAEECASPVIAGFNGGFLRHHTRRREEELAYYAGFRLALERSPVPVSFLLNESDSVDQMRRAMELGFNGVMPECEGLDAGAYCRLVQSVVRWAHSRGVWVEAQLGMLPSGSPDHNGHSEPTDPNNAQKFVADTGVDALAISVGNVHVMTTGKAMVDVDMLRRVRDAVDVPLVLHGGTSIAAEQVGELVRNGVSKLNYGTVLKQAYLEAVRQALGRYKAPASPHRFLGMGSDDDLMTAGREAVKAKVKELLVLAGSANRVALPRSGAVSATVS